MRPAARIQAAVEVLHACLDDRRPAAQALADWGRAHRFAGSGDRSAIGNLVYDVLRHKASAAFLMQDDAPRALALGTLRLAWCETVEAIASLFDGSAHAPAALTEAERAAVARLLPDDAPDDIRGNFPAWLGPSLSSAFGDAVVAEASAFTRRAPLDLRVNTLRTNPAGVLEALARFGAVAAPHAPTGIRIAAPPVTGRTPNVEAESGFSQGWYEIQDEGSQIAALLAGATLAKAGSSMQVADICAGAGGKTLALAATMENRGRIHAYDADGRRLKPIHQRLLRAGVHNVAVLDAERPEKLAALAGAMDVVLIDAPCSGSGTWRRSPESKWRLTKSELDQRCAQQRSVLDMGAPLVRPGGRLAYVTCSILPEENRDQVTNFLARHPDFAVIPFATTWREAVGPTPIVCASKQDGMLQLTARTHGTDGFFIALLQRRA